MLRGAVAGENIDKFAFGFGDNALVLLLSDLKIYRFNVQGEYGIAVVPREPKRTSSALSSAMGLTGLLALTPTLPGLLSHEILLQESSSEKNHLPPELSSKGCKNFMRAVSCDGLD